MKIAKISFENEGKKIRGIMNIPENVYPAAVLMSHSLTVDKNEYGIFKRMAESLCENGYLTLRYDYIGHGESEGKPEDVTISTQISDLKATTNFILKQKIDKNNLGLLAASFGGAISILCNDYRIKTMVLWNPVIDFKSVFLKTKSSFFKQFATKESQKEMENKGFVIFKNDYRIGKQFWKELNKINVPNHLKNIKIPTLIIHGDKDTRVPLEDSKKYFKLIKAEKELKIIEGANHGFNDFESEKKVIDLTLNWFNKWLKNAGYP